MPSRLIDLTPKQVLFISSLYLLGYTKTEFLVKAFLCLSGLKMLSDRTHADDGSRWFIHRTVRKPFLIAPDQFVDMISKCEFVLNPGEVKPLRWIKLAKARHFRLYNATFDEYLMAENYFFAYTETNDGKHLDNLISVLYRRPWQHWNSKKIQKRAVKFRKVDPAVKNAVFLWYVGFRHYVSKRCKTLFSGGKSSVPFNPRGYINGIIHQLNNGDITIKDILLRQPAWSALDELEQRAIEVENIKSK
jgi:hypothetical protein